MKATNLVRRSLFYYWRTNLAVVLGVATAVTVLAGALLVGDSVRGTLRELVLQRLGRTDYVLVSSGFFREQLAADLESDAAFDGLLENAAPIIAVQGLVTNQTSGQRALGVQVYGVDERFWRFHGLNPGIGFARGADREVLLSSALARDVGATIGDTVLLRIQRPSDIPLDSLHGRKDDPAHTLRLTLQRVLSADELGDFSLQPQQGEVRAAFVPIKRLQEDLDLANRVNAVLLADRDEAPAIDPGPSAAAAGTGDSLAALIRAHTTLDDVGVQIHVREPSGALSIETLGTLIDAPRSEAITASATALGMTPMPVFTYLVNTIATATRSIPYSLVTAIDLRTITPASAAPSAGVPAIVLNEWAARDLDAKVGDVVRLDFLAWQDPGQLVDRSGTFQVSAIVPIRGLAADRDLVPFYPGLTDSDQLRDWNPPFPINLRRVRPQDEDYWREYRTTPKAFIPLEAGQTLWKSKHGLLTSIRVVPPAGTSAGSLRAPLEDRLHAALDPFANGLALQPVRSEGLAASRGATDFGEYFTYFSFVLVISALVLAALFFKLGVEQRGREVGLLRAVGFTPAAARRHFLLEAVVLSVAGSLIGIAGALGYGALMTAGLRTWWVDAVGTSALKLHVSPVSLAAGAAGGVLGAMVSIWWTLRSLNAVSERSLLAGNVADTFNRLAPGRHRFWRLTSAALLAIGLLLIVAARMGLLGTTGAFFGAGAALLGACLFGLAAVLRSGGAKRLHFGHGVRGLARLGLRNTKQRPGRSVLSVAVIASATFVLISVGAFRKSPEVSGDIHSGTGGYALQVSTLAPIIQDPASVDGRQLLGLEDMSDVAVTAFRVRPGDDTSCLNLYQPRQPRILAASHEFIAAGRFSFQSSSASSPEEAANPWLLLERPQNDGAIPVIADANSATYVLHKSVGDELLLVEGDRTVRLRLVATLSDSLLQSELVMSEPHFQTLFPEQPGYRFLLIETRDRPLEEVASALENQLSDYGADAVPTAERLAEFHKVENTYLSTFQTLGGLGLLLGTVGLAAVLLRNVLERRRELALLSAVGYRSTDIFTIVITENAFLLVAGLLTGAVCALVAIVPAVLERGGRLPSGSGLWLLLFAILVTGLLSSFVATRATLRTHLLNALKAE